MRAPRLAMWAFISGIAAGCGDSSGTGPSPGGNPGGTPGGTSSSITVSNNQFVPSATTVAPGTTVTWVWAQGATDHNVTFDDGPKSATQSTGTFARSFATAGTYPYRCTIHPGMTGTVTVR